MHAQRIIQDFLAEKCKSIHAKRRACLAVFTGAAHQGGLGLLKMSKSVPGEVALRHRIKRCDRLLSNPRLQRERPEIYRALARSVLAHQTRVGIIVDWSDLLPDISQHVLRASVVAQGRAIVIYEEVHPTKDFGTAVVHRKFMEALRALLPATCEPVIITDAGFRATWFKMLDALGFAWIGRIRNRDMVRSCDRGTWRGCKELYVEATNKPRDLGQFEYARANPVPCRLAVIKKMPQGRKNKNVFGQSKRNQQSNKQRAGQREPWLLAISPKLSRLSAKTIVAWYGHRMQIEQTFRDLKCAQWGMGLETSQTRQPKRLAILLLIAALLAYSLWLIGLAVRKIGYRIEYGSKNKAASTLSILSLARHWARENHTRKLPQKQLKDALIELTSMLVVYER